LLRHAESAANAAPGEVAAPTGAGDRLSARGREQARAAAEALRECGARRLLCSPMRRARETAEPLAAALGLELAVEPCLHEVDEGGEEESFEAVLARIARLKAALEGRPGETSLVVTHGIFKRFFLFETLLGEGFEPRLAPNVWSLGSRNCGLSVFEHGERPDPRDPVGVGWTCLSWMGPPSDPAGSGAADRSARPATAR
jgi:broad specificity phosphatase PhoE